MSCKEQVFFFSASRLRRKFRLKNPRNISPVCRWLNGESGEARARQQVVLGETGRSPEVLST